MQTTKYQSKSILVNEVTVTEDNMEEVAEWCEGTVSEDRSYIEVPVHNPVNKKQRWARVGDHVLHEPVRDTFKVYTPKAFENSFERVFGEQSEAQELSNIFEQNVEKTPSTDKVADEDVSVDVNYRDSITGEYVTKEYALANPDTTVKETEWETPRAGGSVHNPFEVSTGHEEVTDDGDSTRDDS